MEGGAEAIRVRLRIKEVWAELRTLEPGDPGRIPLLEEIVVLDAKDVVLLRAERGG